MSEQSELGIGVTDGAGIGYIKTSFSSKRYCHLYSHVLDIGIYFITFKKGFCGIENFYFVKVCGAAYYAIKLFMYLDTHIFFC